MSLSDLPSLVYQVGTGSVGLHDDGVRLELAEDDSQRYSDAQLDDYHLNGVMRWRPPLRMKVRARFSHPQATLRGTAGFGFWNDPFGMTKMGQRVAWLPRLRLPQAVWFFFASPPSNMALATGVPGFGWKAATIDADNLTAKVLLPLAPFGMLACRVPIAYRLLWQMAQRVLKIDEALLPVAMDVWHTYSFVWDAESVSFMADDTEIFRTRFAPRGPLGFVAWIDNQYMVATPQGQLRNGVIANGNQWLEIAALDVVAG